MLSCFILLYLNDAESVLQRQHFEVQTEAVNRRLEELKLAESELKSRIALAEQRAAEVERKGYRYCGVSLSLLCFNCSK